MKEWIDEKIDYLHSKTVENFALFEPTKEFYEKLEKVDIIPPIDQVLKNIDENKPPYVTFDDATKSLEKHLGRSIPRIEFYPMKSGTDINGGYIAGKIQVRGESREIRISSDYRKKAKQLGTILAHELAHDFLFSRGITLTNTDENERLTDLASIILGLGKLTLNGIEEKTYGGTKKLCYLSSPDLAYAYVKVNSFYKIIPKVCYTNLDSTAYSLIKNFDEINIRKFVQKMINDVDEKNSLIQKDLDNIFKIYYQIKDNQDLINKNIVNMKIDPVDGKIFVNLNSSDFHQDFEDFVYRTKSKLIDIKKKSEDRQKQISVNRLEVTIQNLENLIAQVNHNKKEVEQYSEKLFEVLSVQEKYFPAKSDILENKFKELIKKGNLKEAIILAKKEDCNLLNNLGVELAKKKDKIAFEIFEKILLLDSGNAIAYYNLGCAYLNFKQYNEAVKNYQIAIKIDPRNVTAYYNCGNAYFNLEQYWDALGNYRMAVQLNSDNRIFHEAIKEVCNKLKELDPNNFMIYSICGDAHYNLEQYWEALVNYQMALKGKTDDPAIRENLKKTFASFKKQGLIIYIIVRIKSSLFNAKSDIKSLFG